jgi:TonB-linked SusC/RagA family outer membrane protein
MKICAAHAMLATIVCGATFAHEMRAQILDKKVTVDMKDVTLEQALYRIEDASEVNIYFSLESLDTDAEALVTIAANDEPLGDILDNLLSPRHIRYKVDEKNNGIIILRYRRERSAGSPSERSASGSSSKSNRWDDPIIVTGTVTDAATQQPLAGVNVLVKGTTQGTTSDSEGRYIIRADEDDVLVFSFIGFAPVEVHITNRSTIDVSMKEDVKNLNEVVVNAGYYETTDRFQTGNITTVDLREIEKQPVLNPLSALMAQVPGLEITQQTGIPGGNFQVRIRGVNSIANGNDPLYIVDGVPYTSTSMAMFETSGSIFYNGTSPLNTINPADIESIEVLKDADATAIYGSRGSNGVILITTRKGQAGKIKVDLKAYSGVGQVANRMDLLSTEEYLEMRHEAFDNDAIDPTAADAPDLVLWDTTRYTDWQKDLLGGRSRFNDVQVSVSGGSDNVQFIAGAGLHREGTVFPGSDFSERMSVHSNITSASDNNRFRLSFTTNYSLSNSSLPNYDLSTRALLLPPDAPAVRDANGDLSWEYWSATDENPLVYLDRVYSGKTTNAMGNLVVGYKLLKDLELSSSFGYTNTRSTANTVNPARTQDPLSAAENLSYFSNNDFENWIIEPQLNFKRTIFSGELSALVGATFLSQQNSGLSQTGIGFSSEALMKSLSSASTILIGSNFDSQYRYQAFFSRLNYVFREKYIINLTARRDGSSRFGPGKQFSIFSAVGAAWIFSEERLLKNHFGFLSFGKLRFSYGTTGNDQLGDYQYIDTYGPSGGQYQGVIGLQPERLSNPLFAWESNRKLEGGLDLRMLRDRIGIGIAYYRNRSSNQLVGFPLPTTTGFTTIQGNFPAEIQNSGLEVELTTQNIASAALSWRTSVNLTVPRNKLVRFDDLESFAGYSTKYIVGQPLNILREFRYTGIDQVTGLYTFQDVNEDGAYDIADRIVPAYLGRNFFAGLLNTIEFKGLTLDFLFQFVQQSGYSYVVNFAPPGASYNMPQFVMNSWKPESTVTEIQRFGVSGETQLAYSRYANSDRAIGDASFVRMKNVALSYQFPSSLTDKISLSQLKLFIQCQNLLTLTSYKGLDPETQTNNTPPLRVITGGIQMQF